jgi:hypothetical protein
MEVDDAAVESTPTNSKTSSGRIDSIMESDYEEAEVKSVEPEDNKLKSEVTPSSGDVKKEEKKEDKKEEKEEKKEEKKDKKEEEKKEAEKKKYKYKVDGQEIEEELTDEEVNSAISGRKAIEKRFAEINREKTNLKKEKESFQKDYEYVKNEMMELKQSFDSVIGDFKKTGVVNKNPVDGMYNLLDKMGLDVKEYDKALFYHFVPEVAKFLDMDDTGREAFLLRKDNEWYQKERDKLTKKEQETSEYRSKLEQENSLKRQNGISEEQFSELKDELETKFGLENLNTEQVIQWSKERPSYARAENIAKLVPGTDIIKVARILLEFPETTDEWMLEQLGYKEAKEKQVMDQIKDKIPAKNFKGNAQDADDEDDELFKNFRRR